MKSIIAFTCLCFIGIIYAPQSNSQKIENFTIVYAVTDRIFSREIGKHKTPKTVVEIDSYVTSFATYNDYLYASLHSNGYKPHTGIWRVKKSSISSNSSTWQQVKGINSNYVDFLSMTIAKGNIYAGRNDGVVLKCPVDKPNSCQHFHVGKSNKVTEIEYNPNDGKIYVVSSHFIRGHRLGWSFELWQCPPDNLKNCSEVFIGLDGRTNLLVAFDAFWIADAGKIRKCPFDNSKKTSKVMDEDCFEYHDFGRHVDEDGRPIEVKISHSSKYLYVRMDLKYTWRCDPGIMNSCYRAFRLISGAEKMNVIMLGDFIIV